MLQDQRPDDGFVAFFADGEFAQGGHEVPVLTQEHVVAAAFLEVGEAGGEVDEGAVRVRWVSAVRLLVGGLWMPSEVFEGVEIGAETRAVGAEAACSGDGVLAAGAVEHAP